MKSCRFVCSRKSTAAATYRAVATEFLGGRPEFPGKFLPIRDDTRFGMQTEVDGRDLGTAWRFASRLKILFTSFAFRWGSQSFHRRQAITEQGVAAPIRLLAKCRSEWQDLNLPHVPNVVRCQTSRPGYARRAAKPAIPVLRLLFGVIVPPISRIQTGYLVEGVGERSQTSTY